MFTELWPFALLVAVSALVLTRAVRDLRRRRTLGHVTAIVDGTNRAWLERLALHASVHREIVRGSTDEAHRLWREDAEGARVRLRLACEQIERVSLPRLNETLRVLRDLARSARVLVPPRPLAVAAWRILRTRVRAALVVLLDRAGLTGRERVRVRLWFVRHAFVAAAQLYTATAVLAVARGFGRPWYPKLDAAVSDMQTAHDETVVTAERILDAVARWKAYNARRCA